MCNLMDADRSGFALEFGAVQMTWLHINYYIAGYRVVYYIYNYKKIKPNVNIKWDKFFFANWFVSKSQVSNF